MKRHEGKNLRLYTNDVDSLTTWPAYYLEYENVLILETCIHELAELVFTFLATNSLDTVKHFKNIMNGIKENGRKDFRRENRISERL